MQQIFTSLARKKLIPLSYWAQKMSIQAAKQTITEYPSFHHEAQKFNEMKFYSHLAQIIPILKFENPYEQQVYTQALEKYRKFAEVDNFLQTLHRFSVNATTIYFSIQRNVTSNNIISRHETTNTAIENDFKEFVGKYISLVNSLEDYPEWKKKTVEQVGHYVHLIYNNLEFEGKEQLFEGFNKHDYFV